MIRTTGGVVVTVPSNATSTSTTSAQSGTWTVQPGNTANTTAWKVDGSAVTQPVSGTVATTQSGTWNTGHGKTLKTAAISVASSGDNTIVALVSAKRLKVTAFSMQATGTVNVKWKDGASTDITGAYNFQAREGLSQDTNAPSFLFATTAGNALILNLSANVSVVGFATYFDDDAT